MAASFPPPFPLYRPNVDTIRTLLRSTRSSDSYDETFILPTARSSFCTDAVGWLFASNIRSARLVFPSPGGIYLDNVWAWSERNGGRYSRASPEIFDADRRFPKPHIRVAIVGNELQDDSFILGLQGGVQALIKVLLTTQGLESLDIDFVGLPLFDTRVRPHSRMADDWARWGARLARQASYPRTSAQVFVSARPFVLRRAAGADLFEVMAASGSRARRTLPAGLGMSLDDLGARVVADGTGATMLRQPTAAQCVAALSGLSPALSATASSAGGEVEQTLRAEVARALIVKVAGPDSLADASRQEAANSVLTHHAEQLEDARRWREALAALWPTDDTRDWVQLPRHSRERDAKHQIGLSERLSNGEIEASARVWVDAVDPIFSVIKTKVAQISLALQTVLDVRVQGALTVKPSLTDVEKTALDAALTTFVLTSAALVPGEKPLHVDGALLEIATRLVSASLGLVNDGLASMQIARRLLEHQDLAQTLSQLLSPPHRTDADLLRVMSLVHAASSFNRQTDVGPAPIVGAEVAACALMLCTDVDAGLADSKALVEAPLSKLLRAQSLDAERFRQCLDAWASHHDQEMAQVVQAWSEIERLAGACAPQAFVPRLSGGTLALPDQAIVSSWDLVACSLQVGELAARTLTQGQAHTTIGDWAYAHEVPHADGPPISLFEAIGTTGTKTFAPQLAAACDSLLLPREPSRVISYEYVPCVGARWLQQHDTVLRRVSVRHPDIFLRGLYVAPSDHALAKLKFSYVRTDICVVLPSRKFDVQVPELQDDVKRSRLAYTLQAEGDRLSLTLSARPIPLSIVLRQDGLRLCVIDASKALRMSRQPDAKVVPGILGSIVFDFGSAAIGEHLLRFSHITRPLATPDPGTTHGPDPVPSPRVMPDVIEVRCRVSSVDDSWFVCTQHSPGGTRLSHTTYRLELGLHPSTDQLDQLVEELRGAGCIEGVVQAHLPDGNLLDIYAEYADDRLSIDIAKVENGFVSTLKWGEMSLELPGRCAARVIPGPADRLEIEGVVPEVVTYKMTVSGKTPNRPLVVLLAPIMQAFAQGRLDWSSRVGQGADYLVGAQAYGNDAQGRTCYFTLQKGGLTLIKTIWTANNTAFELTDDTLTVTFAGRKTPIELPHPVPGLKRLELKGVPATRRFDARTCWKIAPLVVIDKPEGVTDFEIEVDEDMAFERAQVDGAVLTLYTSDQRALAVNEVMGTQGAACLASITVRVGSTLAPLHDIWNRLRGAATHAAGRVAGQYLGTSAQNEHFFMQPDGTDGKTKGVRMFVLDGHHLSELSIGSIEALASQQPFVISQRWLVGESGLVYQRSTQDLRLVGMLDRQGGVQAFQASGDADYRVTRGSGVRRIDNTVYVHIRQRGPLNATIVSCRLAEPTQGPSMCEVALRGSPGVAFSHSYFAPLDVSLLSGLDVQGTEDVEAASVWVPHRVQSFGVIDDVFTVTTYDAASKKYAAYRVENGVATLRA